MQWRGAVVCYLADWGDLFCGYGVAAIPLPRAVLFRQAVTRYDFLWLEQPTPARRNHRRFYRLHRFGPIRLEIQPYWWISDGPHLCAVQFRPTVPLCGGGVIAFASAESAVDGRCDYSEFGSVAVNTAGDADVDVDVDGDSPITVNSAHNYWCWLYDRSSELTGLYRVIPTSVAGHYCPVHVST